MLDHAATSQRIDPLLTLRLAGILAAVIVGLTVTPVRGLVAWLTPGRAPRRRDLREVQQLVRHLDGLLRRMPVLPYGRCLLRSLVLYYFCTRLGYPVRIAFGVRDAGSKLEGHGWLELDGRPFMEIGAPEPRFATILRLPEARDGR